jgi:hypothetical protein
MLSYLAVGKTTLLPNDGVNLHLLHLVEVYVCLLICKLCKVNGIKCEKVGLTNKRNRGTERRYNYLELLQIWSVDFQISLIAPFFFQVVVKKKNVFWGGAFRYLGSFRCNLRTEEHWYVPLIDGFNRCNWLYPLKHKYEVLYAFPKFYSMVCIKYSASVKIFRSDNRIQYVNKDFNDFMSSHGVIHKTTCVNTAEKNGGVERKNIHLLEVARSLVFMMNVSKLLCGEAVKTTPY